MHRHPLSFIIKPENSPVFYLKRPGLVIIVFIKFITATATVTIIITKVITIIGDVFFLCFFYSLPQFPPFSGFPSIRSSFLSPAVNYY